jgi:hypothetical protein
MPDRGRERTSRSRSPSKGGERKKSKKEKKAERDKKKEEARKLLEAPDSDDSSEVSPAGGPVAAIALPENLTTVDVDMLNSLCRSVNALTMQVAKVSEGMDKVADELRSQKIQVQAVASQVEKIYADTSKKMKSFETDMANINDDINKKISEMSKKLAAPTYASAASAAASSSTRLAPPALAASSGHAPSNGRRPTRLWLKGFKETLTTKFLTDFARRAIDRLAPDLRVGAEPGAPGFGATVYVDYPANTHMLPIRNGLTDLNLTHTDSEGNAHNIRVSPDQSLEARHRGRALGELWKLVEPHLSGMPIADRPKDFKLGNSNGKLFLVLDNRPLEFFSTSLDDQGNLNIVPNDKNLKKFKISAEQAQAWAAAASRTALRAGR